RRGHLVPLSDPRRADVPLPRDGALRRHASDGRPAGGLRCGCRPALLGAPQPVPRRLGELPHDGDVESHPDDCRADATNGRPLGRGVDDLSPERLKELLGAAVKFELSTIPPYLCALYSLHPKGNDEAKLVIRSVVVEEMLHMVLAANVLNAIEGEPRVAGAEHAPRYPHELPDGMILDLLPFSPEAIDAFLKVENPQHDHHAIGPDHPLLGKPRPETHAAGAKKVMAEPSTIGAFYGEIVSGLEAAAAEIGEQQLFCGDPARQVTREYYYAGGGSAIHVTNLDGARRALVEIVEQGEGDMHSMYDDDGDLAHYYRFQQVKHNRAYLRSDDS